MTKHLADKLKRRKSEVDIALKGPSELLTEAKVDEEPFTDFTMLIQQVYEHIGKVEEKHLNKKIESVENLFEKNPLAFDSFKIRQLYEDLKREAIEKETNISSKDLFAL